MSSFRDLLHDLPNRREGEIAIPSSNTLKQTDCFRDGANIAYYRYGKDRVGSGRSSGWEFEDVIIAMAHFHRLKYRAVVVLSHVARRRGKYLDKKRMDDLEACGFLVWEPPDSSEDIALLQLAYV